MHRADETRAQQPGLGTRPGRLGRLPIVVVRVVQFGLDLALLALLCLVPLSVTVFLPRNPDGTLGNLLVSIPLVLLALATCAGLSWWCFVARPVRHAGRTLAMGWLGLQTMRADGTAASAGTLTLRWIMLLVDGMFFGAVGLVAMVVTPRRQRLGDLVADAVVVRASTGPEVAVADPELPPT